MKVDFANYKVNIFVKEADLKFASSGHYAIQLSDSCKDLDSALEELQLNKTLLTTDDEARKPNIENQQKTINYRDNLDLNIQQFSPD